MPTELQYPAQHFTSREAFSQRFTFATHTGLAETPNSTSFFGTPTTYGGTGLECTQTPFTSLSAFTAPHTFTVTPTGNSATFVGTTPFDSTLLSHTRGTESS